MTRREKMLLVPVLDGPDTGLWRIFFFNGRGEWRSSFGPMPKDEARRRIRKYRRRERREEKVAT